MVFTFYVIRAYVVYCILTPTSTDLTKTSKVRMFIVNNLKLTFYHLTVRKSAAMQVIITKHKQPRLSFYSQHSGQ